MRSGKEELVLLLLLLSSTRDVVLGISTSRREGREKSFDLLRLLPGEMNKSFYNKVKVCMYVYFCFGRRNLI